MTVTQASTGQRIFSAELKTLMVRKKKIGRLVLYIRERGSNETSCVFLDAPILDRVKGVGGVGEDQKQDMEAVSEQEHLRCITERAEEAQARKRAFEPVDDEPELPESSGVSVQLGRKPSPAQDKPLESLTVKQLLAVITLEDLDVDTKQAKKPVLIQRIVAARAGLPDPTKEPVLAG